MFHFGTSQSLVCDAFSVKGTELSNTKYLFYCLTNFQKKIYETQKGRGVPHVHISSIENFEIPPPPLDVQNEIVKILDNFTELATELESRVKQYEYYKYKFLNCNKEVQKKTLGDLCNLEKGNTPIQKAIAGEYPLVVTAEQRKTAYSFQFDKPSVCIPLISSRGHGVTSLN